MSNYARPPNSTATPTLGNPQARAQMSAAKQAQLAQRQRQIHAQFAGGVSNRLLLSLRSGIPSEIDFALESLVQYSYTDAIHIPYEYLPGLPNALLEIIRPSPVKTADATRRRLEAALTLRNLIIQGGQAAAMAISTIQTQLFTLLTDVLRDEFENTELLLYLLHSVEIYAPHHRLQIPSSTPLKQQNPEQQLYPLLARLATSNDRALIIGSFSLLCALAINQHNEPVFAYTPNSTPTSSASPDPIQSPTAALVHRAVQLLSLTDADILLPVLEFLYQNTLIPANGSSLLLRQDLRDILRILVTRVSEGARRDVIEYEVIDRQTPDHQNVRGKAVREALLATYPSLAAPPATKKAKSEGDEEPEAKMSNDELQRLLPTPEPQRAKEWMQSVLEAAPTGEITQVNLWKAYQQQFEPYDAQMKEGKFPSMLSASEVIKTTSDAFPSAQPKVVEELGKKRFVISGIRVKPKASVVDPVQERLRDRWRCKWQDCPDTTSNSDPQELYQHLQTAHTQTASSGQTCGFGQCSYPSTDANDLSVHLRAHVLPPNPPASINDLVHAADAIDQEDERFYETIITRGQVVQGEFAAGIGFAASLVLRNVARSVASAAQRFKKVAMLQSADSVLSSTTDYKAPARHGAEDDEEEDEARRRVFGFLSGKVMDTEGEEISSDLPRELTLNKAQLSHAVNAFWPLTSHIVNLTSSANQLTGYLIETLDCLVNTKKSIEGLL